MLRYILCVLLAMLGDTLKAMETGRRDHPLTNDQAHYSFASTSPSPSSINTSISTLDSFPSVTYPPIVYEIISNMVKSMSCALGNCDTKHKKSKGYISTNSTEDGNSEPTTYFDYDYMLEGLDYVNQIHFFDPEGMQKRTDAAIDTMIDYLTRLKHPENVEGIMNAGFYSFTHLSSLFTIYGTTIQQVLETQLDKEHVKLVMETMVDNIGKEFYIAYKELKKPLELVFHKLMSVTDNPEVEKLWDQLRQQLEPFDEYMQD